MSNDATMEAIDRFKAIVNDERKQAHKAFAHMRQRLDTMERQLKQKNDEIRDLTAQNEKKRSILAAFGSDVTEELVKRVKEAADAYEAAGGAAVIKSFRSGSARSADRQKSAYQTMLSGLGMLAGNLCCMRWSGPMFSLVEVMDFPMPGFENDVNVRVVVNLGRNTFFNIGEDAARAAMKIVTPENVFAVLHEVFNSANLQRLWDVDNETLRSSRFKSSVNMTFSQYCNKVRKDTLDAISGHSDFAGVDLFNGSRSAKAAVAPGSMKDTPSGCPVRAAQARRAADKSESSCSPAEEVPDVVVTHERTLDQRNAEGFANAIVID